jgi:mono/diheme cytochrome c family protein
VLLAGAALACTSRGDVDGTRENSSQAAGTQLRAPAAGNARRAPTSTVGGTNGADASNASNAPAAVGTISRAVVANVSDTLLANADVYAGWRSFNINCQSCHGFNAVASDAAPDLRNSVRKGGTLTRTQFHEVVMKGRMAKGMPAWGALLDAKQIDQIYAYLLARSTGALGAGRPSVGGE